MQSCYYCGKLILGRKCMGQIGNNMHTFCSEKCRSSAWVKAGEKRFSTSDSQNDSNNSGDQSGSSFSSGRSGVSTLAVSGAEYEYSAKTDGVTIQIAKLENKSSWQTGKIRLELFLSKSGGYVKGQQLSGFTLAISNTYQPLRKHYSYTAMKTTAHLYEKPKAGTYQPVLLVREEDEEGRWRVAAFVNFPGTLKWS